MIEVKMTEPNKLEIKDMTIPLENDIGLLMDRIHEEIMEQREEHAKKYVAELLNNLLNLVSNMTCLQLDNIEIWNNANHLTTDGMYEEYRIVRWIEK